MYIIQILRNFYKLCYKICFKRCCTGESHTRVRRLKNQIREKFHKFGYDYTPPLDDDGTRFGCITTDVETDTESTEPSQPFHFRSCSNEKAQNGDGDVENNYRTGSGIIDQNVGVQNGLSMNEQGSSIRPEGVLDFSLVEEHSQSNGHTMHETTTYESNWRGMSYITVCSL